ncbi:MAG TPA: hypothetical protein VGI81_11555 [Tepidisphaeraceae bacterium]
MFEDYTSTIREFLSGPHAEAREWLQSGEGNKRRLIEHRSTAQSLEVVERLYSLGAERVLAVGLGEDSLGQSWCRYLLVELPDEPRRREALFAFEREHAEATGFDATPDEGQLYLFLDVKGLG